VEVLLGTGMRISEALSLSKDSIDFATHEARIIGRGNKQRVVFFTEESLGWVQQYFNLIFWPLINLILIIAFYKKYYFIQKR
jgi:site-specific recombinase XerD